jgi:predicted dehydrogenase
MTFRIGVLSFAHYHANFWCEAFAADPRVSLVGVWDDDALRLQTAASAFEMQPFGDIESLLASVDGVAICSETAAIAMLRWDNGLLAEVATSWSFAAGHDSVEVYGSKATFLLAGVDLASRDLSRPSYLRLARHGAVGWETLDVVPRFVAGGFHHAVASAFADYVLGASEPCSTPDLANPSTPTRSCRAASTSRRRRRG